MVQELGAGKVAEWTESLLHKHEVLSSDSCENLYRAVYLFNPKAGSAETGGSLELIDQLV